MDSSNKKIITLCFASGAFVIGLTLSLLIKALSGAFGFMAKLSSSDIVRHGLPVAVGLGLFFYCQFSPKVRAWADEVIAEVKKVVFPSQKDTMAMTVVVIVMVLISSLIIASFDFISAHLIKEMVRF